MNRARVEPLVHSERGVSLTALGLAAAALVALVSTAIPLAQRWQQTAAIDRLCDDGAKLFDAIVRYNAHHGFPPPDGTRSPEGMNVRTFAPLSTQGYLDDAETILASLEGERVMAYDTPGLPGREGFWLILADRQHPEIQLLVASTDAFPMAPETWLEGIYLIRGSSLEKLRALPLNDTSRAIPEGARHV
jgi:hypothetical protein